MIPLICIVSIVVVSVVFIKLGEGWSLDRIERSNEEDNYAELCEQVRANSFFDQARVDEAFDDIVQDCD